jgi:Ala-tRNA(Pro) deacylase
LDRLIEKLNAAGTAFTVMHHAPVFTSEEAARVRGTALSSGAKALLLKVDDRVVLCVLPADRKLDSRKLRAALGVRNSRFLTADEVLQLTGLRPGSIPPFGSLLGIATYCDPGLAANATINFNAGDHAISLSMSCADFFAVESPETFDFTAA